MKKVDYETAEARFEIGAREAQRAFSLMMDALREQDYQLPATFREMLEDWADEHFENVMHEKDDKEFCSYETAVFELLPLLAYSWENHPDDGADKSMKDFVLIIESSEGITEKGTLWDEYQNKKEEK